MIVGEIYLADPEKTSFEDDLFGRFSLLDEKGSINHSLGKDVFAGNMVVCVSNLETKEYTIAPMRQQIAEEGYVCLHKNTLIFIEKRHSGKFKHLKLK